MNAVPPDNACQGAGRLPLAVRWGSGDFVRLTVVGIYQRAQLGPNPYPYSTTCE